MISSEKQTFFVQDGQINIFYQRPFIDQSIDQESSFNYEKNYVLIETKPPDIGWMPQSCQSASTNKKKRITKNTKIPSQSLSRKNKSKKITSKNGRDSNSCKIVNPAWTYCWKNIMKRIGKLQFKTDYLDKLGNNEKFASIKSHKGFSVVMMVQVYQTENYSNQMQCIKHFEKYHQKIKNKPNIQKEKKKDLNQAIKALKLFMSGDFKESIICLYGYDQKNRVDYRFDYNLNYVYEKINIEKEK